MHIRYFQSFVTILFVAILTTDKRHKPHVNDISFNVNEIKNSSPKESFILDGWEFNETFQSW